MLSPAFLIVQLTLLIILGSSGLAKLRAVDATQSVLILLKLPKFLQQRWVAVALPWGEFALAAGLLVPWPPIAALFGFGVLILFAIYWIVIARALRFDPRPTCGCFGQIGDQSVSGRTLVRNTLLVGLAAAGLAGSLRGLNLVDAFAAGAGPTIIAWAVSLICAVLIIGLPKPGADQPIANRVEPAAVPAEELEYIRTPFPDRVLLAGDGKPTTFHELVQQKAVLLVFINCFCGSSMQTIGELPGWRERLPQLDVHLVASMSAQAAESQALPPNRMVDHHGTVWRSLDLTSSPAAVLLGADGLLAGGPVYTVPQIAEFVEMISDELALVPAEV